MYIWGVMELTAEIPIGYVYSITNNINGKKYVGLHKSTEFDPDYWGSGKLIHQAYNKYGKENFTREILEWALTYEELQEKEKYWIKSLDTYENGYNLTLGGDGGVTWASPELNPAKTPEAREKIRQQKLELAENHPMKSEEQRKHISECNKGRLVGEKNPMKRQDIIEKHLAACQSKEHRKKLSVAGRALGENHPSKRQEYKIHMSEIMKKRFEDRPEMREKARQHCKLMSGANNSSSKRVRIVETQQEFETLRQLIKFLEVGEWVVNDRIKKNPDKPINSPKLGNVHIELC